MKWLRDPGDAERASVGARAVAIRVVVLVVAMAGVGHASGLGSGGLVSIAISAQAVIDALVGQAVVADTFSSSSTAGPGFVSAASSGNDGFRCTNEGCEVQTGPDTKIAESGTSIVLTAAGGVTTSASLAVTTTGTATSGWALGTNASYSVNQAAWYNTAPTISSGFGTSPSVLTSNGTAYFRIDVGTGGTANSGVIGLPNLGSGQWLCLCEDMTTHSTTVFRTRMTATSSSSCTVGNFSSSAAAAAWAASDVLHCTAVADP